MWCYLVKLGACSNCKLKIKPSKGQSFLELPLDIVQLSQLLHLIVPEYVIFPDWIRNMKSLHTLRCFHCQGNSPEGSERTDQSNKS